ncbi:hypothetical protein C8J56DRAFT_1045874 [Mycena floridula]|nr:hypothetical protein C8J56DRAFT_1045874 [Mycena floridula]
MTPTSMDDEDAAHDLQESPTEEHSTQERSQQDSQEIVQAPDAVPSHQPSIVDNTPIRLYPVPQSTSGRAPLTWSTPVDDRSVAAAPIIRFLQPETLTLRPVTFTASTSGTPHSSPGPSRELPKPTRRVRYSINMDSHYDPTTRVFSAAMELPGVRKPDLRVILSTCTWNSVRQVIVFGTIRPWHEITGPFSSAVSGSSASTSALPVPSETRLSGSSMIQIPVRERHYGAYTRNIVVPCGTMPVDVDAHLDNGLLMLKIRCGELAPSNERCEVPVR